MLRLHYTDHRFKYDKNLTLSKCLVRTCSLFPRMWPMYALFNASSKSLFDAQPPCGSRTQQTKVQRERFKFNVLVFPCDAKRLQRV